MKISRTQVFVTIFVIVIVGAFAIPYFLTPNTGNGYESSKYPDFFTSNEDFFVTRIGSVPSLNEGTYRLYITGLVDNPTSFTLGELRNLTMVDLPLTYETISNPANGHLISTAIWRGFILYDLLVSLGLHENASGVQYRSADGYYSSSTMEQVMNNGTIGALYMNGADIPAVHGYPLRIINPGYFGVKQPAWVEIIEVINKSVTDYWEDRNWKVNVPMEIDSMIFFPSDDVTINVSEILEIGGAAFGGTRVSKVEYSLDFGSTWENTSIVQSVDADHVWVFWGINLTFSEPGLKTLYIRATDIYNHTQQQYDPSYIDGTSQWPTLQIFVGS